MKIKHPAKAEPKNVGDQLESVSDSLDKLALPVVRARLRDVVNKIGFKAAEEASGKSLRTLHRYLDGSMEPPVSVLLGLSLRSGYPPGWFFSPTGDEPAPSNMSRVPVFELALSAGFGAEAAATETAREYFTLPTMFLRVHVNVNPESAAALPIVGDSMEPTLHDGALAIIDTSVNTIDGTGIFALRHGDQLMVKRVVRRADGSLLLSSDNPRYPADQLASDKLGELKILGRVGGTVNRS